MANLNFTNVVIGGRICHTPELQTSANGIPYCKISVAVNNPGKDSGTSFFDVVAWRGTAELLAKYFVKGSCVCISGQFQQRKRTGKDGLSRSVIEINADRVNFVDSASERPAANHNDEPSEAKPAKADEPNWDELGDDEDIPF